MAATGLSLELVREFLLNRKCRVEYHQLVQHFKSFLFDQDARVLFKDIVNTIADVTQEGSTKFIVLKPAFYFSNDVNRRVSSSVSSSSSSDGNHPSRKQVAQPPMPPNVPRMQPLDPRMQQIDPRLQMIPQQAMRSQMHPYPQSQPMPQYYNHRIPMQQHHPQMMPHQQPPNLPPHDVIQRTMRATSMVGVPSEYHVPVMRSRTVQPPSNLPLGNPFHDAVTVTAVPYKPSYNEVTTSASPTSPSGIQWSPNTPGGVPPQPPPRRRSSMSSSISSTSVGIVPQVIKTSLVGDHGTQIKDQVVATPPASSNQEDKLKEIHELAKTPGRVKVTAEKWNKMSSAEKILSSSAMITPTSPTAQSDIHSSSSSSSRPTSRVKDDDTDSGSVQPLDPVRKKWMLAAALCEIDELQEMLKDDPKLANFKDTTSGGYTALHLAYMFGHESLAEMLIQKYGADPNLRDFSGKLPKHYLKSKENVHGSKSSSMDKNGKTHRHLFGPSNSHSNNGKGRPSCEPSSLSQTAFTRIGSLNSKMKKTARAITGIKAWGSSETVNDSNLMRPPSLRGSSKKKKERRKISSSDQTEPAGTMAAKTVTGFHLKQNSATGDLDTEFGFQ